MVESKKHLSCTVPYFLPTRKNKTLRVFILLIILFFHDAYGQEKLSLQNAIATALKNNYSVLILQNEKEIAANNNSRGNAGMLPSVTGVAGTSQTVNDTKQNFSDGREIDRNAVSTKNVNAGALLNWTLFDGTRMFATKNKLEELASQGDVTLKIQIENTIAKVISAYFDVTQRQKLLDAINLNIAIDSERVVLAQTKLDVGSGSRLDLLQAKVDLNEQVSTRMKQVAIIFNSKDQLNYLLSLKPGTDFLLTDSIIITENIAVDSLHATVPENNFTIRSAVHDQRISLLSMKEAKSYRYPEIDFTGGYNYTRVNSQAGLVLLNQNLGFNYGLLLQWNLFNGSNTSRQIKNAKLSYQSSEYNLSDVKLQVATDLEKAVRDYKNNLAILHLEEENIFLARENLNIAFERYRSGLSITLELQQAQKSFLDAEVRLLQVQYDTKLSETELLRLNGELVK